MSTGLASRIHRTAIRPTSSADGVANRELPGTGSDAPDVDAGAELRDRRLHHQERGTTTRPRPRVDRRHRARSQALLDGFRLLRSLRLTRALPGRLEEPFEALRATVSARDRYSRLAG